jgi:putative ABC transport system substrate-binding protein
LIDLVPGIRHLAALADSSTTGPDRLAALQQAAAARGVELSIQYIANGAEIAPAVEQARAGGAQAINVLASALLYPHRRELIERIAAARLPAIYQFPEIVEEDALMGYGPRLASIYRDLVAPKLIKVLRGVKPADIPAEQPTAFELGINLKTGKALGLVVPALLLAQAMR